MLDELSSFSNVFHIEQCSLVFDMSDVLHPFNDESVCSPLAVWCDDTV